jgi:hypothetical protein
MEANIPGTEVDTGPEIKSPLSEEESTDQTPQAVQTTETPAFEETTTTPSIETQYSNSTEQTPEITKEQLDEPVGKVVEETNQIVRENNINESLDKEQYSQKVYEKKDTPQAIQKLHEIGLFKNCEDWNQVNGELSKLSKDVLREMLLLQLVGATGAVAILEPSPLGEIAFGAAVAFAGKHSKVVQSILNKESVDTVSDAYINSGVKSAMKSK